jgi:2-polyprenyl-3-methyl-5-hydroxy-6-metoxy-1,4-benzoquinol methylase
MKANTTYTNQKSWNAKRYDAWVSAYGSVDIEAKRILSNPEYPIRRILPLLGAPEAKRICSVQGSHGRVAVALAAMGADVHVIDFAEENRRYATELSAAACVSINYVLCDIMEANSLDLPYKFDALVLELGILHYHQNIDQFFAVMRDLVADDGMLILNEFHPVQRKLNWKDGPQDYFFADLVEADVPNPDGDGTSLGKCQYRFWTMGEILNALIGGGFRIALFEEHPDWEDCKQPGTFTVLAHAAH